uniref:vomeronasal type-2 receptor 26-like n=1 Tax=Euleptes europaea TaxID=460621 RepID=UPI002540F511|nr:vomeronasal type-2 receptor 26-like [Euleptes europaea]
MEAKCSLYRTIQDNLYRPGEAIIGGVLYLTESLVVLLNFTEPPDRSLYSSLTKMRKYQHVLALIFAIDEINKNPKLLPNVTLGFHIYDNFFHSRTTHEIILDLLFTEQKHAPNYLCDRRNNVLSIIGEFPTESMIEITSIFNTYKIPQFTYGTHKTSLCGKTGSPSLHWISPKESTHHMGIVQLLLHFQWRWIGLIVSDDDGGESFLQNFIPVLAQHSICVAFLHKDTVKNYHTENQFLDNFPKLILAVLLPEVNVIILKGDSQLIIFLSDQLDVFEFVTKIYIGKVWIMPPQWYFSAPQSGIIIGAQFFQGALSFSISTKTVPGFWDFLHTFKPDESMKQFFCVFWQYAFNCHLSSENNKQFEKCIGNEKLESLPIIRFEMDMTGQSYTIYNAVYAVAHALHAICLSRRGTVPKRGKFKPLNVQPWQLQSSLKNIHFNNGALHEVLFENGELSIGYDVVNWVTFPNQSFLEVQVGKISPSHEFFIQEGNIVWNNRLQQMPPHSKCVESCHLGYSQIIQEGKPPCCYDCAPCPENMISNNIVMSTHAKSSKMQIASVSYQCPEDQFSHRLLHLFNKTKSSYRNEQINLSLSFPDAVHCVKCPEDQYPNKNQDQCRQKIITFLSYKEPLGIVLLSLALSFSVITCLVMQIFWKNWNTPIVKANNRPLTCILLTSILLCYLSSLFFIGKPVKDTCIIQQMAFGVIFSVSVSCVLAKTVIVVLAFKAAKPGNRLRKFLGKSVANFIVLSSFLIQVGICIAWVSTTPPFLHADMHSQAEQIIVECNEGSITMFYSVLGYVGFLAIVSFAVAFLARKLPDTFNEAKFITFSMLVFCSVWVSFLPAYVSTKGKHIVAVEIFSILASNTGLLACIFSPKCYIIIVRTDLNSRKLIIEKRS